MRTHQQERTNEGRIVDRSNKIEARQVANVEVQTQTAKIEQTFRNAAAGTN